MLLAAGSGLYLYHVKNRTRLLDRQIAQVMQNADAIRAHTGVLQAEWALQNDPQRLQDLADRFLALRPLTPTQFVTGADLDHKLPPIGEGPSGGGTTEPPVDRMAALDLRPDAMTHQDQPDPAPKPTADTAPKIPGVVAAPRSPPPPQSLGPLPAPSSQTQPVTPLPAPVVVASRPALAPSLPPPASGPAQAPAPFAARPVNPPASHPMVLATAATRSHRSDDADSPGNAATAAEVISRIRGSRGDQAAPTISPLVAPLMAPTITPTGASVLGGTRAMLAPPVPVAAR
jgi:hypothetical protein